jgi:hypothetical protein
MQWVVWQLYKTVNGGCVYGNCIKRSMGVCVWQLYKTVNGGVYIAIV